MEYRELSNLYLDLSKEILNKINFEGSVKDNQNQLLFITCLEKSISYFTDEINSTLINGIPNIETFCFSEKWLQLSKIDTIKNIFVREIEPNGLIVMMEKSKQKLINANNNLIVTDEPNNLKKYNLILDKYKDTQELLRKMLDEC
ncbi:MAG: hypothetical protein ACJ0FG_02655 [Gammaproteobacteria bacterium]